MDVDVVIEVPRGSANKYEIDRASGAIRLDRTLSPALRYPVDYGFLPGTLGEDGDPLDALVPLDEPAFPGCRVGCRAIGLLRMADEAGGDAKVLAVPHWDPRTELGDVSDPWLAAIRHFFDVYKDLEPGRSTVVIGWEDRAAAESEVRRARERFRERA